MEESVRVRYSSGKRSTYVLENEYLSVNQIHVDKANAPETTASSLKLMHRFKEEDVLKMMDTAEQS
jgi:hypothetical protein